MVDGNAQQQLKYEAVLDRVGLLESLSDDARAKVADAMHTKHFADGEYIICQVRAATVVIGGKSSKFGISGYTAPTPSSSGTDRARPPPPSVCQGEAASTFFILLEGAATASRIQVATAGADPSPSAGDTRQGGGVHACTDAWTPDSRVVGVQAGHAEPTVCMQYTPGSYFGEIALLYKERRRANVVADGACTVGAMDRGSFTRLLGPLHDLLEAGVSQYHSAPPAQKHTPADPPAPRTPPQHTPRADQDEDDTR